jgi:hypothetical protein
MRRAIVSAVDVPEVVLKMMPKMANDRRKKFRFTIEREIRYKLLDVDQIVASGVGCTTNISSGGVAFLGQHALAPGQLIELSISWPVLLDNTCPMRLIVFGRVVRSEGFCSACTIDRYEFRTQGRAARETATPIRNDGPLRRWAEGVRIKEMEARASA